MKRLRTAVISRSGNAQRSIAERLEQLPPDERVVLGGAGFRTFMTIADQWQLSVTERVCLLGDIAESTYHK